MSVQTHIDRINQNVANTYAVLSALGADLPAEQSSDNLASTAGTTKAVLHSKQTLTAAQQIQARTNIGAASQEEVSQLSEKIPYVIQTEAPTDTSVVWIDSDDDSLDELSDEITEYIASELAKRGQLKPEFANSIEECTDTTKLYVLPDGYIYAYMLTADTEPEPLFTNRLPLAINADGTPYVGPNGEKGYKPGYRVSSSGSEKEQTFEGYACTGFIPAKPGDVIRVKNVDTRRSSSADDCAPCTVCHYDANFARIGTTMQYWRDMPVSADGTVTMTLDLTGAVYIRTSLKSVTEDSILTVNEEIAYSSGSIGYAWANTGRAFVPADYEERIVALENALANPEHSAYNGNILYGKKWVACGDSFTYKGYATTDGFDESVYKYQDGRFVGKNIVYPYIIGLRNNMDIVNIATGGQTMAASDNSFMTRYADIDADADYAYNYRKYVNNDRLVAKYCTEYGFRYVDETQYLRDGMVIYGTGTFGYAFSPNPNFKVSYHHNAASWEWENKSRTQKHEVFFDKLGLLPLYKSYKKLKKNIKRLILKK